MSIPARSSIVVDLGRRVPAGIGFSVRVDGRTPIVAETLDRAALAGADVAARHRDGDGLTATGAPMDRRAGARVRHVAGRDRDREPERAQVVARVRVWSAGKATTPPDLERIELAPGKRTVIDLVRLR